MTPILLREDATNIEDLFSSISPERLEELLRIIGQTEMDLRKQKIYTPVKLIYALLTSDLAKTQEESLFIAVAVGGLAVLQTEKIAVAMDAFSELTNITYEKKATKAD